MTAEVEKKAVDLGKLEEDDEFEEFPTKGKNFQAAGRSTWSKFSTYF